MKRKKIINSILLYILVLFLSLSFYSSKWAVNNFAFLSFDETLFQLTSPIKSAQSTILTSYLRDGLFISIICSILVFFFLFVIVNYLSCKRISIDIKLWKKRISFSIKTFIIKIILGIIIFIISMVIVYRGLDRVGFISYFKDQINESLFIEENYVNPRDVKITFPENKKNLIYIYVESLETTYFSEDLGGGTYTNLLYPITDITSSNINFSDTNKFGGALSIPGTTWTTGALVAHTSGLPLKISAAFANDNRVSTMMSGTITIGDILHDNGYNQMFMIGSDKDFGNRGVYFETHGNYEIYDYYTAIDKEKISKDYLTWWGFEDAKLFEFAKEEITKLSEKKEPFNFTLLTANTHFPDGYYDDNCTSNYNNHYFNSVNCNAKELEDFINWIYNQPFYENTTVIIVGDHISMQTDLYPDSTRRRIYNLFINSSITEGNFYNREFSTMDFFPTTLASLGVEIEGDRLGLGTNLFSDKQTLIEEVGYEKFKKETSAYSSYYMKHLLKK